MTYEEALHKSAAYCSQSEHCRYEIEEKLLRWQVDLQHHEKILAYLEKEKYIDQQRYALAYVRDKFKYNKWGKIRLNLELQRRRIDATIIRDSLTSIDDTEYQEMANQLVINKLRGLKYNDNYERNGKLYRYLAGRGFESDVIHNAIHGLQS